MATKTVTFESNYAAYQLVREPKVDVPLPTGTGWQTIQKGITYKFDPTPSPRTESGLIGILRVKAGADKRTTDGERWLADDQEVGVERDAVQALMAHRNFGHKFWLQGFPPGTLYPRPQDLRRDLRAATAQLDEDKAMELLTAEQDTHQRADLLEEIEDSLAVIREERAKLQAMGEEPKAKAKPKAAAPA